MQFISSSDEKDAKVIQFFDGVFFITVVVGREEMEVVAAFICLRIPHVRKESLRPYAYCCSSVCVCARTRNNVFCLFNVFANGENSISCWERGTLTLLIEMSMSVLQADEKFSKIS